MQEIFLSQDGPCKAHWHRPQGIPISEQLNGMGRCLLEKVSSRIWAWSCQVQVFKVAMDNNNLLQWNWMCWNGGGVQTKKFGWYLVILLMLVHNMFTIYQNLKVQHAIHKVYSPLSLHLPCQALLSLQAAATKMFPSRPFGGRHVDMRWGVEIEESCQKILAGTYGTCCFHDIMTLGCGKKTAWCTTHKNFCNVSVPKQHDRISAY